MLLFKHQSQPKYVPLKQVSIEATIRSFAVDVSITQVFRNDETTPIEAVYCFPIEEQAAVYAFRARIDDREIVAQLKKKDDAQREYNDALRQGHGAYLLEQDEKSPDNFVANVGSLLAGTECHITISYVSELDLVENGTKIRFVVPTTIAPRYNPDIGNIGSPAGTTSQYVQSSPYTIKFRCRVEKVGILRISSMSHPIQVDLGQEDIYVVGFAQQDTHLDRDILLDIELAENRSNTVVAVEPGAIMASFTPTEDDCRQALSTDNITNEFIFVVDCSGSMDSENKIELARQAMLLFLKSLPVGCHFNIIRFGSRHKNLFEDITTIYARYSAHSAQRLIENMKADLGGTELLLPLQWLKEHPPAPGHARQIFLLTDGEISNVDEVLNLCRSMSTSTRIFSFGLGFSPSRALVKGLARATNGRFVFIPPYTNVDLYVGEQLQKALQPCITNVQVEWNIKGTVTNVAPKKSPPVYVNDRLIVYAFLDDQSTSFDHDMIVKLYSGQHCLSEAHVNRIPTVSNDQTITRLATKALILELQHEELSSSSSSSSSIRKNITQEHIIELSLKYNILSPYTAFVGIEKRVNASNADMVLREVPIQISADGQEDLEDQQLSFATMGYEKGDFHRAQNRYNEARRHYDSAHMHCREARENYDRAQWEFLRQERDMEILEMNFYKSLQSPKDHYEMRSSQMHRYTDNHRDEPRTAYHSAQRDRQAVREHYRKALHELEYYQDERESSEMNYFEALKALSSYHDGRLSSRRSDKAYEDLGEARTARHEARRRYIELQREIMHLQREIESSENNCYEAFETLSISEVDMPTEMNTSSNFRSHGSSASSSRKMKSVPTADHEHQDIVRQLINKQEFDGLWNMDSQSIEQLIGKPLTDFQQWPDKQVLTSAIVIVVLEKRFPSLVAMWYGVVQKARKRLIEMLDKTDKKLDTLLEDIKKQL